LLALRRMRPGRREFASGSWFSSVALAKHALFLML
jgi:hypothetical protein